MGGVGGKYKDLEDSILSRAWEDSHPPKKFEHPHLTKDRVPESVYLQLTEAMDDILDLATLALYIRRDQQQQQQQQQQCGSSCVSLPRLA